MSFRNKSGEIDEATWVQEYMKLAGVTESEARNVFMYIMCSETAGAEKERIATNELYKPELSPENFQP